MFEASFAINSFTLLLLMLVQKVYRMILKKLQQINRKNFDFLTASNLYKLRSAAMIYWQMFSMVDKMIDFRLKSRK